MDDTVDIQILDYSKTWRTIVRSVGNLQVVEMELQSVQRRYPDRRVRAVDSQGRLIDLL
jgi:hypothetical protein